MQRTGRALLAAALIQVFFACGEGSFLTAPPEQMAATLLPPGAPRIFDVTPGSGRLTIQFTAPETDGGSPITEYRYSVDKGSWTTAPDALGSGSLIVDKLENGRSYAIALRAVNHVGAGDPVSVEGTPTTTPGQVRITRIDHGDRKLVVIYPQPDSGGYRITGYQYTVDAGEQWVLADSSAASGSMVISDLVNGKAYAVQVRALSAAGFGIPSPTVSATPMTVPGPPSVKSMIPAIDALVVSVDAPADNGGDLVTGWDYSLDAARTWVSVDSGAVASFRISGLRWGVTYNVLLRARNMMGAGPPSPASPGVPLGLPAAPTILNVVAADGTVSVDFAAPAHTGTSPLTAYEYSTDSAKTWAAAPADKTQIILRGLRNGDMYGLAVRAVTAVGTGPASAIIAAMPFVVSPKIDTVRTVVKPGVTLYIPQMLDAREPSFDEDLARALTRYRVLHGRDAVSLFEKVQAAADYVANMAKHPYRHNIGQEYTDPRSWEYQDFPAKLSELAKENQQWNGLEWVPADGKSWMDVRAIECSFQDLILGGLVNALGAQWMLLGITHHDAFTYYDIELGKWVYIESSYNEHYRSAESSADNYVPLSPAELRAMNIAGDNSMVSVQHPYQPRRTEVEFYLYPYVQMFPYGFNAMMADVNGITRGQRFQLGTHLRVLPGGRSEEVFREYLDGGWTLADPNEEIWAPQGEAFIESLHATPRGNVIRLSTNLAVTQPIYERKVSDGEWTAVPAESELNGLVGEIRFRARKGDVVSGEVVIRQSEK
jgi:hypothetical protein